MSQTVGVGVSPGVIPDEGQCPSRESAVHPVSRPRCAPLSGVRVSVPV